MTIKLTELPAWQALTTHFESIKDKHLRYFFQEDPTRGERLTVDCLGIHFDYSKHRINDETITLLINLANESGLTKQIERMFHGDIINNTEQRAALHVALRALNKNNYPSDYPNIDAEVQNVLQKMSHFSELIRQGLYLGFSAKPIRNIVNIGIGGSDLGPVMAFEALKFYSLRNLTLRFVSNIDATDFVEATQDLNPEETLFIVVSKSFTTLETLTNANSAKTWLLNHFQNKKALGLHFAAVSANQEAVLEFGIRKENRFEFWDWVGGRYSMDSAVGLSLMIAIGSDNFHAMLAGFHEMDMHFISADFRQNIPVLMGLLSIWYNNFFAAQTVAILPYEQYLKRFPAYLQQLTMESNGKHTSCQGEYIDYQTGPIYWGEPGTNGQHSFYQLLHQGTKLVPCDFIGFIEPLNPLAKHHDLLIANMFAQAKALAFGTTLEELETKAIPKWQIPHRSFAGNQPSSTLLMDKLTPRSLGRLIAAYEHSVFTCSIIWQIDAFDEWGVELGKTLAKDIFSELFTPVLGTIIEDSSTGTLMQYYKKSIKDI